MTHHQLAPWQLRALVRLLAVLLLASWVLFVAGSVPDRPPAPRLVVWVPVPDPHRSGLWQIVWTYRDTYHVALADDKPQAIALYAVLAGRMVGR